MKEFNRVDLSNANVQGRDVGAVCCVGKNTGLARPGLSSRLCYIGASGPPWPSVSLSVKCNKEDLPRSTSHVGSGPALGHHFNPITSVKASLQQSHPVALSVRTSTSAFGGWGHNSAHHKGLADEYVLLNDKRAQGWRDLHHSVEINHLLCANQSWAHGARAGRDKDYNIQVNANRL